MIKITKEHTPGPWTADNRGNITKGENRLHIAKVAQTGMGYAADANAWLVAAAPDMLNALRIAREHVKAAAEADLCFAQQQEQQHMYGNAARCREAHDMRMCALTVIDRAIAAATGQ